ncbi:MAG: isoprenylcysteine carboxylmethyltransferase family protein [Methanobrevibacter sp.]|uniref:methyltransferase family protein n=1 Tax=Methanobrevibacter sp. TaxID=66852 RepID=UPI0025D2758C|nr:isoprenylcysteine carboxylmethyltransferase family protein [Methanobrevibacter sp.]MBR3114117.1 isoprenylcysteine carboxylmethyltransferase family protein [Methanobrevibacter sp.]MBR6993130.1 isoprenylcysteine carboxylmethyltransferase family protein [Methanobrevibacter sp.]
MNAKLFSQALSKFLFGLIIISLLLFIPAGTLNYPNAWLFLALLFIPMFIAGIIMLIKSPELLKKRLNAKEEENEQKIVILISGAIFLLAFIIAGLNFRFKWSELPQIVIIASSIIFLLSYIMYAEVLRENMYLSRTVEVSENQKVIDRGLYGLVRHPMYTSTIFLFLSMPLILGSLFSFGIMLIYPIIIIFRIKNEEKFLESKLDGYKDYKDKVNYKIIPFIW